MLRILAAHKTVEMKRQMSMDIECVNGGKQAATLKWFRTKHPQCCFAVFLSICGFSLAPFLFQSVFKSGVELFRPFNSVRFLLYLFKKIVRCAPLSNLDSSSFSIFRFWTFNEAQLRELSWFIDSNMCVWEMAESWSKLCEHFPKAGTNVVTEPPLQTGDADTVSATSHLTRVVSPWLKSRK